MVYAIFLPYKTIISLKSGHNILREEAVKCQVHYRFIFVILKSVLACINKEKVYIKTYT